MSGSAAPPEPGPRGACSAGRLGPLSAAQPTPPGLARLATSRTSAPCGGAAGGRRRPARSLPTGAPDGGGGRRRRYGLTLPKASAGRRNPRRNGLAGPERDPPERAREASAPGAAAGDWRDEAGSPAASRPHLLSAPFSRRVLFSSLLVPISSMPRSTASPLVSNSSSCHFPAIRTLSA